MGVIVPFNVYAVLCTPAPDCADMGYTETSCSGKFVRCPFDTSKLFCAPCDSIYKYSCLGNNILGGSGVSCGNKYVSCECVAGAIFMNGDCICDTSCRVGNIYYSDNSCSSCVDVEKIAVGVVVKNDESELNIASIDLVRSYWAPSVTNVTGLSAINDANDAKNDYNGRYNTQVIVDYFGSSVSGVAGVYCYNYAPEVWSDTQGDWYLPAAGELYYYLYENIELVSSAWNKLNIGVGTTFFWTSTKKDLTNVWSVNTSTGVLHYGQVNNDGVVCFLKI